MASLVVRNLDPDVKERLRVRAARNGQSMEAEARAILTTATADTPTSEPEKNWLLAWRDAAQELGGFDLDLPPRDPGDGRTGGRGIADDE